MKLRTFLFTLYLAAVLPVGVFAAASYTVVDIGTLGGQTVPYAINEVGQVAGYSEVAGVSHAFLYSNGAIQDLGTLGGSQSTAYGINNNGDVVGSFTALPLGLNHAFLYSNGVMTDLGTLAVNYQSGASQINNRGQIVGVAGTSTGSHAFLYNRGVMQDLGTLGGSNSSGSGINAVGQVVGLSYLPGDTAFHAMLYSRGTMSDLGALPNGCCSQAQAINLFGRAVGGSTFRPDLGNDHAFLYDSGTMTDLGTLYPDPSIASSFAYAINDHGQIVGETDALGGDYGVHAFLYQRSVMTDLNALVSLDTTLVAAFGINNAGQIAAFGSNGHGYLLTPIH
jgi:probable HAF family extracellular repeat protein